MPEDSKKSHQQSKHAPKEQRKPRQNKQQASSEKKPEVNVEKTQSAPKEPKVPAKPPVYEDPGPEFYKNLKRETDEILKITEEANSKYKKKEIQSNWSKYEMPIKTYDEVDEEENLGADYEKLIQAPQSVGGHFQFKHEKSWDISTGPSLYDKYFEINMDNLCTALSTIPFYERNNIDTSIFSQTDLQTMNNRSIKYKQKYYNDRSYTTPELDAQDKILNLDKEGIIENDTKEKVRTVSESKDIVFEESRNNFDSKVSKGTTDNEQKDFITNVKADKPVTQKVSLDINVEKPKEITSELKTNIVTQKESPIIGNDKVNEDDLDDLLVSIDAKTKGDKSLEILDVAAVAQEKSVEQVSKGGLNKTAPVQQPAGNQSNPVIESPEDLEKWLDDFLEG